MDEGCSKGCSLLPGKPRFMACPAVCGWTARWLYSFLLLSALRSDSAGLHSCSQQPPGSYASRAGKRHVRRRKRRRKPRKVNTAVVHTMQKHCSSKPEERTPAPSPYGMILEQQALPPSCPVSALCSPGKEGSGAWAHRLLADPLMGLRSLGPGTGFKDTWQERVHHAVSSPTGTHMHTQAQWVALRHKNKHTRLQKEEAGGQHQHKLSAQSQAKGLLGKK